MVQIRRLDCIPCVNDAQLIDLAGVLADRLDVACGVHPSHDSTHGAAHLLGDEAENRHFAVDGHSSHFSLESFVSLKHVKEAGGGDAE